MIVIRGSVTRTPFGRHDMWAPRQVPHALGSILGCEARELVRSVRPGGSRPEYRQSIVLGWPRGIRLLVVLGRPALLLLTLGFATACQGPVAPSPTPFGVTPSAAVPAAS